MPRKKRGSSWTRRKQRVTSTNDRTPQNQRKEAYEKTRKLNKTQSVQIYASTRLELFKYMLFICYTRNQL